MKSFDFLKPYIFSKKGESQTRPAFYKVDSEELKKVETRINLKIPKELRCFYVNIGYGFFPTGGKSFFNRLIDPESLADFRLRESYFKADPLAQEYAEDPNELAFFEVSEVQYLTIKLDQVSPDGICPVYDFDERIANSLEEFVEKAMRTPNYFIKEETK